MLPGNLPVRDSVRYTLLVTLVLMFQWLTSKPGILVCLTAHPLLQAIASHSTVAPGRFDDGKCSDSYSQICFESPPVGQGIGVLFRPCA